MLNRFSTAWEDLQGFGGDSGQIVDAADIESSQIEATKIHDQITVRIGTGDRDYLFEQRIDFDEIIHVLHVVAANARSDSEF